MPPKSGLLSPDLVILNNMSLKEKLDAKKLPKHIAIIMDGNGRWAKEKGEDRLFGHYSGVESVRNIVEGCAELGIKYLTLYAFSTENWDRPKDEVTGLMELLVQTIKQEVSTLNKNNIRLYVIGNIKMLPVAARKELEEACDATKINTGLNLIMALSYSSRWEIIEAVKNIAIEVKNKKLDPENIDNDVFNRHLCTALFPDPELMIRTSGEYRISNFLLWQISYAELYFTPKFWPDYTVSEFQQTLKEFAARDRRYGGLN